MRLFYRKIKIDNEEFWLKIDKVFKYSFNKDYYVYKCKLYKEVNFIIKPIKICVYSYDTYWLDYYDEYHGDLDKVIDEVISGYKKNLEEQKYISKKENSFKSKYEV